MDVEIVEDDDVTLFQCRQEMLREPGFEGLGVHRAIIGFGRDHAPQGVNIASEFRLSVHKSPKVVEILAKKNCTVRYLPPYSPDFNPIEKAFAKLKSVLRKLAERTVVGLLAVLEGCASLFKPTECENYFMACGYDTT